YLGLPENEDIEKRIYTQWMEHPYLLRSLPLPHLSEFNNDEEIVFLEKLFQQLKQGFENTIPTNRSPSHAYLKRLIPACVDAILSFQLQLEENTEAPVYSSLRMTQLSIALEQALEREYTVLLSEGRYCFTEGQKSSQGVEKNKSLGNRLSNYFKFLRHIPVHQPFFPKRAKKSFQDFKNSILSNAIPEAFDYQFLREQSLSTVERTVKKQFLMICHDQEMDRRIIQQAQALMEGGWCGRVVCLSYDDEDEIQLYEGVTLHRIGKKRLIPEPCPAYWRYQKRTFNINSLGKGFRLLHKWNWKLYKQDLKRTYQCQSIQYPLPFDLPFYQAGRLYPSDLIIAHDLTALKSAHHLAQEWHVPFIYDSHEFYSEQIVFSNYQKQLMDTVEKEYSPDCAAIITVSQSIANGMAEKNNIPAPHVILNVTDPPEGISPLRTHLIHETLKLPLDHKIILFQGGMVPRRNLSLLVEGFRHLNPTGAHLVMLGPSHPKYLNKLQTKAGPLLNQSVHFLPAVPQQQLLHFTTSADCGVIPYPPVDLNTKYCLPNKTFEYIQACLPILSNDLVELGLLFERIEGGGLVTDLNSVQTMRDALQNMLHRDLNRDRERLAQIKESFTWKKEKGRYLQIVEQAMVNAQQ
ncbi:MAG: glycosyltransferase, partial [Cyanobacteria bacterium]|nr:glycosyltransferase [Cyanobacteriota bacterium]